MEGSAKKRQRICDYYGATTGPSCSHGMVSSSGYDYEVFLSFRGPDTREGFTNFLYTSLTEARIRTFKDDEDLRVGEEFAPKLLQAIKQSKISIPIFSKGYTDSAWCLKELVQMVECMKSGGHKIMPIFYDVAPSEVRYQTGGYRKALLSLEKKKRYDKKTISEWKAALSVVGELNGWDLHSKTNRREGEFAKKITEEVSRALKKAYLEVSDRLVKVDNHVDAIMEKIGAQTSETRIIGIHGMGGVGKTTIAKIIYNQLSNNFKNCCFLSNIHKMSERKGIECLQNQPVFDILKNKSIGEGIKIIKDRLSNKRVLLLLDDVEEESHIDALVGRRDWLGRGSKIIITTRKKSILNVPEVDCNYEISIMDFDQSLQLFSKHAFRRDSPLDEYIDQSNKALHIAGGLPLALEVMGSLLCRIEKKNWDITLKKWESVPDKTIQSTLKISYDALDVRQQHIFLDIACLFIGYNKDIMVHFWDESKFPEEALEVLQNMSLIKIKEDNEVWMHDQLRDLGREMVRQESKMEIEKQSRVWNTKEALNLLRRKEGKMEVEALCLKLDHQQVCFTYEGFENLSNLRFLELDQGFGFFHVEGRLLCREPRSDIPSTYENSDLLPQLRWLCWRNIPPTFNLTNFSMEGVVFLDLSWSKITDDWKGWSHMKVMRNLEVLYLSDCKELQRLPDELGRDLASLKRLFLQGCYLLERLPDSIGNLKLLIELDLSGTSIKGLPDSIGNLKNLKVVTMFDSRISKIPDALWTLGKLEEIFAIPRCNDQVLHVNVGKCISGNKALRSLHLMNAEIYALPALPESLIELSLVELHMDTFPNLSNLTNLKELYLAFSCSDEGEHQIPRWIENLTKLEFLTLFCHFVTTSRTDLSLPPQLKKLHLSCTKLCCLENLRDLKLDSIDQETLPDLSNLNKLTSLHVSSCDDLVEIQGELPQSLERLEIAGCGSLQKLPDFSSSMGLRKVEIRECRKLNVEAISLLCLEKSVEFVGDDDEFDREEESKSEGEDAGSKSEYEGEDEE